MVAMMHENTSPHMIILLKYLLFFHTGTARCQIIFDYGTGGNSMNTTYTDERKGKKSSGAVYSQLDLISYFNLSQ